MSDIFSIFESDRPLPLVFDSPHSGSFYPADFQPSCDLALLRKAEDSYIDDLFSGAPKHGASLLCAHTARSYIDLNRAIDDIDLQLLDDPNSIKDANPTARSDAGIGLIWRLAKPGVPIYNAPLSADEIEDRIQKHYIPYHAALKTLLDNTHYKFGQVWHINCHSMPASTAFPKRAIGLIGQQQQPVDFCLGNRDGTSCDLDFTREVRKFLDSLGYTVTLNDPFKGVELVERYSNPARGRHALQIEINRALYMDEVTREKSQDYESVKADIEKLIQFCASYIQANLTSKAAD